MAAAAYIAAGLAAALCSGAALAQDKTENFESWRLHTPTFGSTGGNGVIIGEYRPVISGDKCSTDFTATLADGKVYYNTVEFDAVPAQGGILCTNGRWRARGRPRHGPPAQPVLAADRAVRR